MNEQLFDGDLWKWKSLEDYSAYKDMFNFVNNHHAMEIHKKSLDYLVIGSSSIEDNTDQLVRDKMAHSIINSLAHFASQTLVSLCTTYEVAAKDFFKNLFIKYPSYMHDYIGEENHKGKIKLNDIISAGGYDELIKITADKSSSAATKGKYGEILIKASKICKEPIDKKIIDDINKIQSKRNKIVHEKHIDDLPIKYLADTQNIISHAIELLCTFAIKKEIPRNYTCINPEEWVITDQVFMKNNQ